MKTSDCFPIWLTHFYANSSSSESWDSHLMYFSFKRFHVWLPTMSHNAPKLINTPFKKCSTRSECNFSTFLLTSNPPQDQPFTLLPGKLSCWSLSWILHCYQVKVSYFFNIKYRLQNPNERHTYYTVLYLVKSCGLLVNSIPWICTGQSLPRWKSYLDLILLLEVPLTPNIFLAKMNLCICSKPFTLH